MNKQLTTMTLGELFKEYTYAEDFFISLGIRSVQHELTFEALVNSLSDEFFEDCGMERGQIFNHFMTFMQRMSELKKKTKTSLDSVTILGGQNKLGEKENVTLTIKPGEIICIVGPTGSGKSRLLGDIECLAQWDTPTGRQILVNGEVPAQDKRFSVEHKLVAQLSQNMNFVMDLTVEEFVEMHAESRMVENVGDVVKAILQCANELAGEKFTRSTSVTQLSGGQSRALMIADTALLSSSPIVLIDEIENAGVDRKKALDLLVKKEKIVLMSTHDPILALMGDKRLVIKNGGIYNIIETSQKERQNLDALQKFDSKMLDLRNRLRLGDTIEFDVEKYFYDSF